MALKKRVHLLQINQQLELKRQRKSTCKQHIMTRKHGADVTCQHIAKHHSLALKCQKAVFLFLVSFLTTRWTSSKWQELTKLDLICGKAVSIFLILVKKIKWSELNVVCKKTIIDFSASSNGVQRCHFKCFRRKISSNKATVSNNRR